MGHVLKTFIDIQSVSQLHVPLRKLLSDGAIEWKFSLSSAVATAAYDTAKSECCYVAKVMKSIFKPALKSLPLENMCGM